MNEELKKAFKTLSDYCEKQPTSNCVRCGGSGCELHMFCQQCINLPGDFYEIYVEEEGL